MSVNNPWLWLLIALTMSVLLGLTTQLFFYWEVKNPPLYLRVIKGVWGVICFAVCWCVVWFLIQI